MNYKKSQLRICGWDFLFTHASRPGLPEIRLCDNGLVDSRDGCNSRSRELSHAFYRVTEIPALCENVPCRGGSFVMRIPPMGVVDVDGTAVRGTTELA